MQKLTRFSLKTTCTQTWRETDPLPPSLFQCLSYLWPFNDMWLQRQIHTFICFMTFLSRISQNNSESLLISVKIPNFQKLALSSHCPVGEAAVIYHLMVKHRGPAKHPGLISEIYSVQERFSKGKLCYKHHQLFIRQHPHGWTSKWSIIDNSNTHKGRVEICQFPIGFNCNMKWASTFIIFLIASSLKWSQ